MTSARLGRTVTIRSPRAPRTRQKRHRRHRRLPDRVDRDWTSASRLVRPCRRPCDACGSRRSRRETHGLATLSAVRRTRGCACNVAPRCSAGVGLHARLGCSIRCTNGKTVRLEQCIRSRIEFPRQYPVIGEGRCVALVRGVIGLGEFLHALGHVVKCCLDETQLASERISVRNAECM